MTSVSFCSLLMSCPRSTLLLAPSPRCPCPPFAFGHSFAFLGLAIPAKGGSEDEDPHCRRGALGDLGLVLMALAVGFWRRPVGHLGLQFLHLQNEV